MASTAGFIWESGKKVYEEWIKGGGRASGGSQMTAVGALNVTVPEAAMLLRKAGVTSAVKADGPRQVAAGVPVRWQRQVLSIGSSGQLRRTRERGECGHRTARCSRSPDAFCRHASILTSRVHQIGAFSNSP